MFVKMCAHRLSKDAMSSRVGSVKHRPKRETPRNEDEDIVDKQRRGRDEQPYRPRHLDCETFRAFSTRTRYDG